ncbi:MAG: radical SAM protein [Desulfobacterales bacterium]
MKILFIASNRLKRVMPPMPLGLASIIATIDESRHEIRVLDLMFSEQPEAELKAVLTDFAPDLIAISVRNIDNQSYLHTEYLLPGIKTLIQHCQDLSDATLVIGGPAFTVSPKAIFAYLKPDFGIAGEAELAFPVLVDRIEGEADCTDLPGLVWQEPDGVKMNPPEFIEDLDSLPIPRRDLFDNQRYAAERSFGNIVIKQGCSFRCLYCDSPHTMGSRWRKKSPEKVVDELEIMQKENGIQMAFFTDAIFNTPLDYAEAVCHAIIDRGVKMGWMTTIHPAHVSREFAELMRDAGCVGLSLASDSCSEKMLKNLRKDITKEDLLSASELLEEMDINYILSFLIGGPGEDRETVDETIDFVSQRSPLLADFCVGIRIMPHTALFDIAVEEGVVAPDDPLMEPKFYVSSLIEDWIVDHLKAACVGHENWSVSHEV